jgi:hypothetical protein
MEQKTVSQRTIAAAISISKQIPGTAALAATQAKQAAEAAATRAEEAADTITTATVEETKQYLGF